MAHSRSSGTGGTLMLLLFYGVTFAFVFGAGWTCESMRCASRWRASGLESSWGPIQGCLVQTPDGRWIPSDNVRGIDLRGAE